jgi:serine/threonine protein kinase
MSAKGGDLFIVDDNPDNLTLLTGILREAGYRVRMINNGRRVFQAVQQHPPELILLDVSMPGMDGYAVCRQLKADERTRGVPVIFLSALDEVLDKVNAFRAGGVDYITKPFQAEEVVARVESQLALTRLRRELETKNRDLESKNRQLEQAWGHADHVFAALSELLPGAVLDGVYRLEQRVGVGGFAAVYRAVHLPTARPVAVKVLRPQRDAEGQGLRGGFDAEARSGARFRHRNAVRMLGSGITPAGMSYLVMELLVGQSFAEELAKQGRRSVQRCADVLLPVCDVLAEAHAAGMIHRDVKPANIFLHRQGAQEVVKLVDFGIAKLRDDGELGSDTITGRIMGTPLYMAPERLLGRPYDERADVYGVAMTLFEALTGHYPFPLGDGALGGLVLACTRESPARARSFCPEISTEVDEVLERGLRKRPEERPSLGEIARAVGRAAASDSDALSRATLDRPIR